MRPALPPDDGTGLDVRALRVVYPGSRGTGPVTAVDGVDLHLASGEVVALLGASGSGKSSLMRAVAGLEDVAAGSVAWGGSDLVHVPVHLRGFGLMFQDGQLFPFRDVAGNVAYGLAGTPRAQREKVVEQVLELVGLPGYGRRSVSTLSGGQAQRVALARALAPRPRLLLLDEPLSALDRVLREQLAVDLREILRSQGTTALYVTHDQDEAMTVADRVGVMESGRLLRLASPETLWRDPGSRPVAELLGYGPFLEADDVAAMGWSSLPGLPSLPAGPGGSDVGGRLALAPGALGVLRDDESAVGEVPRTVEATVLALRVRHGERYAEVALAAPSGSLSALAWVPEGLLPEPGQSVPLQLDPTRVVEVSRCGPAREAGT